MAKLEEYLHHFVDLTTFEAVGGKSPESAQPGANWLLGIFARIELSLGQPFGSEITEFLAEVPEGRAENSPAIHRWVTAKDEESPVGTQEIPLCFPALDQVSCRPLRDFAYGRPYPSDKSVGYSLSRSSLTGIPLHRNQRRTRK